MASKENELILLDFWASMFAMRVKIALAEKGITDYECREEDIVVSKSPFLLQMNPVHKKVPVLIHNGKPICESLIIVEYIDEVWNQTSPLLPTDPYLKSHAKFWADFVDKKVFPPSRVLWTSTGESKENAKTELMESLKIMEDELGNKSYFGGDTFGFVDIALIPFYSWFKVYEVCGNMRIQDECPQIISWAKRCEKREGVKKCVPDMDNVANLILDIRTKHGIH
ncbi:glutathione S-transferase U24-like isoform X2 [Silene latifolia]|uniref:glutathione S-transferase U24-like isoform X2 n=1 Tax=Silene latifolia TaxID=37657 RepID=UPI003D77F36F